MNGLANLDNGSTTPLSNAASIFLAIFSRACFAGSNAKRISPINPPSRTPSFILPKMLSLKPSEVVIIPTAAPIAALPRRPNGPPNNNLATAPTAAPLPAPGSNFFNIPLV